MKSLGVIFLGFVAFPVYGAPIIKAATATPTTAVIGTTTPITIHAFIPDTSLIPASVNVLKLNSDGTSAILGILHDDGLSGDSLAGDSIYTLVVPLNASSPSLIQLQVSAAFKGVLQRLRSNAMPIFFQSSNAPDATISALLTALQQGNDSSTLALFEPSKSNVATLSSLDPSKRKILVDVFRSAKPLSSGPDIRTYQAMWTEKDGSKTLVEIVFVPNASGQWLISSW